MLGNEFQEINQGIKEVGGIMDKTISTDQERDNTLTDRQRIDLTSSFKLPHLIRPIAFIWALGVQTLLTFVVVYLAFQAEPVDSSSIMVIIASNGVILTSIVGFYFNSRKQEKIEFNKAEAAIKLQKIKTVASLKSQEIELKEEVKDNALDRKLEKKANRKPFFPFNKKKGN